MAAPCPLLDSRKSASAVLEIPYDTAERGKGMLRCNIGPDRCFHFLVPKPASPRSTYRHLDAA
jgi:hypothetical protein